MDLLGHSGLDQSQMFSYWSYFYSICLQHEVGALKSPAIYTIKTFLSSEINICFMYLGATVFSIYKCILLLNEPFCYCIMISFVFFLHIMF